MESPATPKDRPFPSPGGIPILSPRTSTLLSLTLLFASCAGGPARFTWRAGKPLTWPTNPKGPWIGFVLAYGGTRDVQRSIGFWERISTLFAGAREEHLVSPNGLAMDKAGHLYIADPGRRAVHKVSLKTGIHQVFPGPKEGGFQSPVGIALGPKGRVFVSDSAAGRVLVLSQEGEFLGFLGKKGTFLRPTGIAWDPKNGRLLVVDTLACRILAFLPGGKQAGVFGRRGSGPGEFNFPTSLAVSRGGLVAVCDSMNFRIQILSPRMRPIRSFGIPGRGPGNFACPKGVALDSENHIYVVDSMFDNVQIFDLQGRLLLVFGSRGTALGRFYLPSGIFIDSKDRIFVSDSGNARVQIFQFHEASR